MIDQIQIETEPWVHSECGHFQEVPVGGGEIKCNGCKKIVIRTPREKSSIVNGRKKSVQIGLNGKRVNLRNERNAPKLQLSLNTVRLKSKKKWDQLFIGFDKLKGVTYETSPSYLLKVHDDMGYDDGVELVIGEGIVDSYKSTLNGNAKMIEQIYDRIVDGTLRIYGTKATDHSKFYILYKLGLTRVICGSPNLSWNAEGSRQREYCWYVDITDDDRLGQEFLKQVEDDYQDAFNENDRVMFMDDLLEQVNENSEIDRIEVFELWSKSKINSEGQAMKKLLTQIQGQAFQPVYDEDADDEVIQIQISKAVKKKGRKFLTSSFGAKISGDKVSIPRNRVLDHRSVTGIIPMELDEQTGQIRYGIGGDMVSVPQDISLDQIKEGLRDIEKYISTVDRATCAHPKAVKMTMFETILYAFASPFVNILHKEKMKVTNIVNKRGPMHLLLYGQGHNGKTVLERYLNFLLTTKIIEPISSKQFNKQHWENLFNQMQTMGSSYPVIIDDIKSTCFKGKNATLEGFVKSYWEEDWNRKSNYPVMILNTNHEDLAIWAKTRIRRLEFNVKFHAGAKDTMLLNELFNRPNLVFPAFAQEYFSQLAMGIEYDEDHLMLARNIMIELYKKVGRQLPEYFPINPPEEMFDMDAISCYNKRKFRIFTQKKVGGALRLKFSNWKSRDSFKARLPPEVVFTEDDTLLIIENPKVYKEFMKRGKPISKRLFG